MALLTDLEKLAVAHLDDARALLAAGRLDGAVHLVGYAVEVALKVRICKSLAWSEFPDKGHEYRSFLVHDLNILLHMSGKEREVRTSLFREWSHVGDWNPEVRYKSPGYAVASGAERMVESAAKVLGVLL